MLIKKIKIFLITSAIFLLSLFLIMGGIYLAVQLFLHQEQKKVISLLPREKVRKIPLPEKTLEYMPTKQTYKIPDYRRILFPSSWLNKLENCIFSTRLNAMKQAGMVPGNLTIKEFVEKFPPRTIYQFWKLNQWEETLNDDILIKISQKFADNGDYTYQWISLDNIKELVYLVKNGVHVMVGITIWLGPNKKNKNPQRYLDSPISHALTVTGIKKYFPTEKIIEFQVADPLPFEPILGMRIFSKIKKDGYNLFNRQGVPLISKKARSGYIIKTGPRIFPVSRMEKSKGQIP